MSARQPVESEFVEDAPDARRADLDVVTAVQVHRDLRGPKWYRCRGQEDLLDDLRVGLCQLMVRHALADFESLEALFVVRRRQVR